MKKVYVSLLLSLLLSGVTYAGISAIGTQAAISLPQPCTIIICAAGMVFYRLMHRRLP